ncbi:MAG: hypothetical protein JWM12_2221, partial [Ilumatobacteraceae bacterium]|nr:hypothetical protein [Ilumatobacteraceae bacterium]
LGEAQEMLTWRSRHTERTLADSVLDGGGIVRCAPWVGTAGDSARAPLHEV